MIKQTTCPNCKINLLIHSRTTIFKRRAWKKVNA